VKRIYLLPNLITLANAFCGLLAMAKAVDALALSEPGSPVFYSKMETACLLIFLAMVFDALDGKIARITDSFSDFGAQLDSFADFLTFGVAPALLVKVLVEHEGPLVGYDGSPRLHFLAAASFSLMALLRLVRFNLENEHEKEAHAAFRGLPSPAAAGALASTMWLYLVLRRPELELTEGTPTPFGRLMGWMQDVDWTPVLTWIPPLLAVMLVGLGLLMVSRLRYVHVVSALARDRSQFFTLVSVIFVLFLFYLAPVPCLFLAFNGFVVFGLAGGLVGLRHARAEARGSAVSRP